METETACSDWPMTTWAVRERRLERFPIELAHRSPVLAHRPPERSEAISMSPMDGDCFASLAMTGEAHPMGKCSNDPCVSRIPRRATGHYPATLLVHDLEPQEATGDK
jgi:hypothetical protein